MPSLPKAQTEESSEPAVAGRESESRPHSAVEIYQLIREAAYFKAQARGFAPGVELQDWLEAEEEVRRQLQAERA